MPSTGTLLGIFLALAFDFLNGMNDAANSIATVVSTRVLPPRWAVAWAAFFNFVAAFTFGVAVATTIGKGIVDPSVVTESLVIAGLIGASAWTYLCTHYGVPISVSHSLIGGMVGAALVKAGPGALVGGGVVKVLVFIALAPLIGMALGLFHMVAVAWVFRRWAPGRVDRLFRIGQLFSAALYSLSHGTNDAQKTMGIIAVLLFSGGYLGKEFYVPLWVVLTAHAAIALGTLVGGWRVIKTMGMRITKLRPVGGFCAETGGGVTLLALAAAGIPVSTTHTIAGAIMGVGTTARFSAVRWGIAREIVVAWVLTIPMAAGMAALVFWVIRLFA